VSSAHASTHREVEVKMRVSQDFDVSPYLIDLPGVSVVGPSTVEMSAAYHDTRELTLLRWGITMRRREGGADAGWHLKLPVSDGVEGARDELHLPLVSGGNGQIPAEFSAVVAPLLRNKEVEHLADVNTTRTTYTLVDEEGTALVEVADDHVSVERGTGINKQVINSFHEIEAEILHDTHRAIELLRIFQARVIKSGAAPSSLSKVASALGPLASSPPDVPDMGALAKDCLAVDLIRQVIAEHTRHLLVSDVGIRRGLPDSIHQMRVAARRLRSTLQSFSGLLDPEQSERLRDELAWMARELGAVRDLEVLLERLVEQADQLPDATDAAVASNVVRTELDRRLKAAQSSALAALRSDRHSDLIEDLIAAASEPPITDAAFVPAIEVITPMAQRTWKKLAQDVHRLSYTSPSTEWHHARIRAKRARYTADAAATVAGKYMRAHAQHLGDVTDILGDLHDAHVAELFLRELAGSPNTTGREGLALGRLLDVQRHVDLAQRRKFAKVWPGARKAARDAGLT